MSKLSRAKFTIDRDFVVDLAMRFPRRWVIDLIEALVFALKQRESAGRRKA